MVYLAWHSPDEQVKPLRAETPDTRQIGKMNAEDFFCTGKNKDETPRMKGDSFL